LESDIELLDTLFVKFFNIDNWEIIWKEANILIPDLSIYSFYSSIILANIDSIYDILQQGDIALYKKIQRPEYRYTENISKKITAFCDLSAPDQGFVDYITSRYQTSIFNGISSLKGIIVSNSLKNDEKWPHTYQYEAIVDNTYGFIDEQLKIDIIQQVSSQMGIFSFDLITSQSCNNIYPNYDNKNYTMINPSDLKDEYLSIPHILYDLIFSLRNISADGVFICKLLRLTTSVSISLLIMFILSFEDIYLFKPLSTSFSTSSLYIIASNKNTNQKTINKIIDLSMTIINIYNKNKVPIDINININNNPIDNKKLLDYIYILNNTIQDNRIWMLSNIVQIVKSYMGKKPDIQKININKCSLLMSLPGPRDLNL
jgi:hypothetical protein